MVVPKQKGEREVRYISDFYYKEKNGQIVLEDTKGFRTKDYIIKRKLMKLQHPEIDFREI